MSRVAKPGEVWITDLGMVAKVRPCLVLTKPPRINELDVFTIVAHTTALRGNEWEMAFPEPFLDPAGAFDLQRIATVESIRLERLLGELTDGEMEAVLDRLSERFGM